MRYPHNTTPTTAPPAPGPMAPQAGGGPYDFAILVGLVLIVIWLLGKSFPKQDKK